MRESIEMLRTVEPSPAWDDPALVEACLAGSDAAWRALVDKYARLIMSVPLRFRFPRADAEDIFQAVCVDLVEQLASVREPAALRGWLVRVATHKCLHARRRLGRESATDPAVLASESASDEPSADQVMAEAEATQRVREAVAGLSQRCRDLLHRLFVETPMRPYEEVARLLGVARGSVSFLRGRCLQRLKRALESSGL
jgi:RNA polymerase sigma factor (sigma-70 family)